MDTRQTSRERDNTYQSQWLAVEMDDMAMRRRRGATSVQYRKLAPRKPMGTKVLYR